MIILELKSMITEMKNSLNGFNSKLNVIPEYISELEHKSRESIQYEEQREKRD